MRVHAIQLGVLPFRFRGMGDALPPASVLPPGVDDNPQNRFYYAALKTIPVAVACDTRDTDCIVRNNQLSVLMNQAATNSAAQQQEFYAEGNRWNSGGGPIDAATAYQEGLLRNQQTSYVPPPASPPIVPSIVIPPGQNPISLYPPVQPMPGAQYPVMSQPAPVSMPGPTPAPAAPASPDLTSLLSKEVGIPFTSIGAPVWMLVAGGLAIVVGGFYFLGGRHR